MIDEFMAPPSTIWVARQGANDFTGPRSASPGPLSRLRDHQVAKEAQGWLPAVVVTQYPPFTFGGSDDQF